MSEIIFLVFSMVENVNELKNQKHSNIHTHVLCFCVSFSVFTACILPCILMPACLLRYFNVYLSFYCLLMFSEGFHCSMFLM